MKEEIVLHLDPPTWPPHDVLSDESWAALMRLGVEPIMVTVVCFRDVITERDPRGHPSLGDVN